jgi:glycosyltransferase involved in cell wall biosynthesis
MRIGIITGEYPPMQGGISTYTRVVALQYAQHGHQVFIFTDHRAEESHPSIHITATVKRWGIKTLWDIRAWAKHHQLDVISFQFETAAYQMSGWVHLLPIISPVPVVTTFHDLLTPYLFPKAGRLRSKVVTYLAERSSGIIATNHEDYLKLKHLPHVELIPLGSNIQDTQSSDYDRDTWRERAGASADDFLIAYFGFMNQSKGVDTLLYDTAELLQAGYRLKLVFIGDRVGTSDSTNATYARMIDDLIANLGLEPFITWTGFVDESDVTAYLQSADAVALPFTDGASYRRSSLMVVIQHKCPIITTPPQVSIPSFIDGENMLFGQTNQAGRITIAPAIRQLYNDPEQAPKLKAGTKALSEHFQWDHIIPQMLTFFQKIIHLRRS